MPIFKDRKFLVNNTSIDFDQLHKPGDKVPFSGIYRCDVCGQEAVSTHGNTLPPQHDHRHPQSEPIHWQLVAKPV